MKAQKHAGSLRLHHQGMKTKMLAVKQVSRRRRAARRSGSGTSEASKMVTMDSLHSDPCAAIQTLPDVNLNGSQERVPRSEPETDGQKIRARQEIRARESCRHV